MLIFIVSWKLHSFQLLKLGPCSLPGTHSLVGETAINFFKAINVKLYKRLHMQCWENVKP